MKKIPDEIKIRLDTVNWIFSEIEKISKKAENQILTESEIQSLLLKLDALEYKFEWEKKQIIKLGYNLP